MRGKAWLQKNAVVYWIGYAVLCGLGTLKQSQSSLGSAAVGASACKLCAIASAGAVVCCAREDRWDAKTKRRVTLGP